MNDDLYREQHKLRLAYMPWLYDTLKPQQKEWARAWQAEIQASLCALETVDLGEDVFIAPQAKIFADDKMKAVSFTEEDIAKTLIAKYHPGEE